MTFIAKSIVYDVFADDGQPLTEEYISWWLDLFGKCHTEEELVAVLEQLVEENILLFDNKTQEYRCAW